MSSRHRLLESVQPSGRGTLKLTSQTRAEQKRPEIPSSREETGKTRRRRRDEPHLAEGQKALCTQNQVNGWGGGRRRGEIGLMGVVVEEVEEEGGGGRGRLFLSGE